MEEHMIGASSQDVKFVANASGTKAVPATGRDLLQQTPVSTLFPVQHRKIISMDHTDTVAAALRSLSENKILSLPVWDSRKGRYQAFIDILDVVCTVVDVCQEIEHGNLVHLLAKSTALQHLTCGQIADVSGRNPFYPVQDSAPILAAIELMAENKVHRIPIVNNEGELVTVVTQSQLVHLIEQNMTKFASFSQRRVGMDRIGYTEVLSVREDERAIDAFKVIHDKKISGMAVVSNNGELVGNISASDLRLIGQDAQLLSRVFLPVAQFMQLQPREESQVFGPYCVSSSATMEEVVHKLDLTHAHRVYVIDENKHPIGVISLGNVLEELLKHL